jgi:voltage-gated potassium channel
LSLPGACPQLRARPGGTGSPGRVERFRRRLFEIIEVAGTGDRTSRAFDLTVMTLISLNVMAVVLSTVGSIEAAVGRYLGWFETFSIAVFTIEYLARLWTADLKTVCHDPVTGRLRYMLTPMAIVDLLAILPFYLPLVTGLDLRFLRAVRLVRLLMLFKADRYSHSLGLLRAVFHEKKGEIGVTFFIVLILIILSSGLMYYIENSVQPDRFGSIPEAILWSVATITSADPAGIYPVTVPGKLLGAFVALLGIGLFALPAGILASGFEDVLRSRRKAQAAQPFAGQTCPHCGRRLDAPAESTPGGPVPREGAR